MFEVPEETQVSWRCARGEIWFSRRAALWLRCSSVVLIRSITSGTCQLDPAPTWLVKGMHGLLSPFISLLLSKSLTMWLLPLGIRGSCRSTTPEEKQARCQWVEELQASIEPAISPNYWRRLFKSVSRRSLTAMDVPVHLPAWSGASVPRGIVPTSHSNVSNPPPDCSW